MKLVKFTKGQRGYGLMTDDEKYSADLEDAWDRWSMDEAIVLRPLPLGVRWKEKRTAELPRYCFGFGEMVEAIWRDEMGLNGVLWIANPKEQSEVERELELRLRLHHAGFTMHREMPFYMTVEIEGGGWTICGQEPHESCFGYVKSGISHPARIVGTCCKQLNA